MIFVPFVAWDFDEPPMRDAVGTVQGRSPQVCCAQGLWSLRRIRLHTRADRKLAQWIECTSIQLGPSLLTWSAARAELAATLTLEGVDRLRFRDTFDLGHALQLGLKLVEGGASTWLPALPPKGKLRMVASFEILRRGQR